jgi:hypothetical protein
MARMQWRALRAFVAGCAIAISTATLLASCASGGTSRLVQPGANQAGKLTLQSEMEWTRATSTRSQMWTMDGELLNLLYLIPTVKEGDYIFLGQRESKRRPDAPYYHKGMREDELRDLVADGLLNAGFVAVQPTHLQPATFGDRSGLRFDVTLETGEGLKYQALVAMFEHDQGLALAIFLAPSEYYFPRDADKVSRMLDTLRWQK